MELIYARQRIVTVAKAFGLQAIDMVHIDFKDLDGLRAQSEYSAKMGFTGKQVIHPSQIDIVHNSYRYVGIGTIIIGGGQGRLCLITILIFKIYTILLFVGLRKRKWSGPKN